ncbi:MAG TPA: glutamate synthase-related protein [Actinomycetota bacterium]|nr:glutamate synthase-related protein [Actinomycetota bacterium]
MDAGRERSACGIGFVADAAGRTRRDVVGLALEALRRLRHRGAVDADARTGDGAGVLLPLPRRFLSLEAERLGLRVPDPDRLGVAMVFERDGAGLVEDVVARAAAAEGIAVLGWRDVPARPGSLGRQARATMPRIRQALLLAPEGSLPELREQRAHRARRRAERELRERRLASSFPSFSFRTVTYKALAAADQLASFYPDLRDPMVEASFVLFHQRYSTNTAPSWERAQPFRMLGHNGEINTIAGNVRRMRAREGRLGLPEGELEELFRPVVDEAGSDSQILDEVVELLCREGGERGAGRDVRLAIAMLVPPAWEGDPRLSEEVRDLLRFQRSLMEPWDGPAALVFTDGVRVGAALDRNGLRPLRFAVCEDGTVACASEAGAVDLRGRGSVRRGKLGPGGMLVVDPAEGGLQLDPLERIARRRPYGAWVARHRREPPAAPAPVPAVDDLERRQVLHGYTREELTLVLSPAAAAGKEPTFSMGDDTPPAVLSAQDRPLYHFLKQRFAQVTNPAIDHLRERHVMSLAVLLGPRDPVLLERPEAAALLELETFLLPEALAGEGLRAVRLDAAWAAEEGPGGLGRALDRLGREAVEAVSAGAGLVVVSDAAAGPELAPVPAALAVGAVHTALLRAGLRTRASLVAAVDDARESHHVACLLALGAEAVHPRLALATVAALAEAGRVRGRSAEEAAAGFRTAIEEGILKVLSKLGISCVDSYVGSCLVDAVGLAAEVADRCMPGVASTLGGLGFEAIAARVLARHARAYGEGRPVLANPGLVKFHRGGEYHAANPTVVRALHRTVDPGLARLRSTAAAEDDEDEDEGLAAGTAEAHALQRALRDEPSFERYERFTELVHGRPPAAIRDLLDLVPAGPPVPLEEVEPVEAILRRFSSGGISHGAVGREAHETLAVAFQRLGARANTGEGGEDPARYRTERNSAIKQVASGRFGVTPEYCAFADELQIKIAQGSKPGEGGQLPGHKVTEEIARLRHTRPGVALISPPPHHDIYSIEDLAQLIFDLKQVNPRAEVSVKLVAEAGVGVVAAGVAKGLAEVVHVAGADGGTGASPLSSIKNAGLPWELGLVETQRVLSENGLRDRVRVRVDGGIKTGRDVVVATLLGADEVSFGTAALLAEGCLMVRTCHLDTCPVGIATQDPELRARFAGTPEMVMAYLTFVAEEVRRILASLGLRSLAEAVGRADLLRPRAELDPPLDLRPLLRPASGARRFHGHRPFQRPRSSLGDRVFRDAWPVVRDGGTAWLAYPIANVDRTVGARLGGAIGRRFGDADPPGRVFLRFEGEAGQSFGAFLARGVEMLLVGEANDYVGKGMGGGRIAIVPPADDAGDPWLVGNTVLYGATGGELYVAGRAGERFAVRNSGAQAVIEGAGDHLCEYMTGGRVVVLGPVGANVGAGMTGGELFVHDPGAGLPALVNPELVEARRPTPAELEPAWALIERHAELTGSPRARALLADRAAAAAAFWIVVPRDDVVEVTRKEEGTVRARA